MKKIITLIAVVFIATTMNAQFYVGFDFGYAIGANKSVIGGEYTTTTGTNIYGSFGQGLNLGLKPGFMFSDNIGAELGINYLIGSTQTLYTDATETIEGKSNGLRLAPQLVIKLENGLYSRFGMIIPVMGKTVVTDVDTDMGGSGVLKEITMESKGSFSTGFIGAIGYEYKMSDNLRLFGEVEYIGLSIKSGTRTITQYDVAGADQLANMTTSQKEIEYVDEIDFAATPSASEPDQQLKTKTVFSSFGINIGITMNF